jgi:hypothetical protein
MWRSEDTQNHHGMIFCARNVSSVPHLPLRSLRREFRKEVQKMRFVVPLIALVTLSLTSAYAPASSIDNSPTALAELQTKADQAQPRDKCFLYAELVSQMTDLAGQQFKSGDSEQASETLKRVQRYAEKIHTGVADDSRKLRDAESLMRRTTFRLKGMLNKASYENRPDLEKTLKELSQIQTELMMQVSKKVQRSTIPSPASPQWTCSERL